MPDVLTPEQRKRNMKNIKAKDTKIEVILRRTLWNKGYRYRKNYKGLPGSPDDEEVNKELLYEGWTVLRFWGDDIKKHVDDCVKVIEETIFDLKNASD